MKAFVCQDSLEGIFTGVYKAWSYAGSSDIRLYIKGQYELCLFTEYEEIGVDPEKAEKVAIWIRRRISPYAFVQVCRCGSSDLPDRADRIFRFLKEGDRYGADVMKMLFIPSVERMLSVSRRVSGECHHYLEFIRFQQLENGILFSVIEPKSQVLALIAPHFADRLSGENWVIYDGRREKAAVHPAFESWFLTDIPSGAAKEFCIRYRSPDQYQELWKIFFHKTAIMERENYRCQRNFLPIWMRDHMTEFQD